MTWDTTFEQLMEDTVTIEPFVSMSSAQVYTYGSSVTYTAQVTRNSRRVVDARGREIVSSVQVIIPERIAVDPRSRITLPTGFSPLTPPIIAVEPYKAVGCDHTVIFC